MVVRVSIGPTCTQDAQVDIAQWRVTSQSHRHGAQHAALVDAPEAAERPATGTDESRRASPLVAHTHSQERSDVTPGKSGRRAAQDHSVEAGVIERAEGQDVGKERSVRHSQG